MARLIEVVLQDDETLESALRRFKRKVQQQGVNSETKKRAVHLKPGERMHAALTERSALLDLAIQQVGVLPAARQDAIAERLLAELKAEVDPTTARFRELVEAKYTRGLSPKEKLEMREMESRLRDSDEAFYRPMLDRLKGTRLEKKPRAS